MPDVTMTLPNLIPALPEVWVLFMSLLTLMVGVFVSKHRQLPYYLAQVTLVVAAALTWFVFTKSDASQAVITLNNGFILDRLACILKMFIYVAAFFTFIYSGHYNRDRNVQALEFYVLGLLSTLGMMILVSAYNLLPLFLGLELMSLPIYAMVAMQRHKARGIEAAMKYFVIGSLASGMLLYGLSMVFGATKTLDIVSIAQIISSTPLSENLMLVFGLVFVMAGVAFKLGAAPFHMWVPDVYDGAPSSVTLFLASGPKIAAFALAVRLFVNTMPALHVQWQELLIVIAILSMGIGNFAAIIQNNIKRMLAYSSIAHMGYMLLGLLCGTPAGYAASMFYVITYSLITLGAFGMIILMSRSGTEVETIDDFMGLSNRNPWLAFMMLLLMFALAGVPPLVGFIAKVGVLEALIEVHLVWLAVLAILFAIVGAFYYIRVVKVMYFENSDETLPALTYPPSARIAITLTGLAVLLIGIFPGWLYTLSHLAFFS